MPKKQVKHEELSDAQKEDIRILKEQIREIKYRGTFKKAYVDVRKGTVDINKSGETEELKKTAMVNLLSKILEDLTSGENE